MNPNNMVFDAKRLIGRKFDDQKIQQDMTHQPVKVVNDFNKPKIQVNCKGEIKSLRPRKESEGKIYVLIFDLGGGTFNVSVLTTDEARYLK